jgi:hypothetical protein
MEKKQNQCQRNDVCQFVSVADLAALFQTASP